MRGVSKCYPVYAQPADRLRQFMMPRLRRMAGAPPRRYYDEYWALRDVSFDVYPGEQLGVVGRNGAGKSTLLQIICGTLTPTTGTVDVSGRVAALLELGAGFNPELTGAENIRLNGSVLGLSSEQLDQRFDSIVAFADIPGFIEQPVKSYSSGMFMRLAFSVAVHVEPDVLVVDEALSVGDEAYQRKCHARIKTLRDRGTTILFVSHSAGHVTEVCDRAVLLDRGRLLCAGSAKDVISRYQKLLYSKAGSDDADPVSDAGDERADGRSDAALPAGTGRPRLDEAFWDEGLAPESTVVYSSRECSIHDAHLQSLAGDRVNVLRPGEEYVYTYRVDFDQPAAGVRFGMMVRSLTGVELAGAVSHPEGKPLEVVASDASVQVRFRFRNLLNPGTYFLNAGVVGLQGEEEKFLVRYMDVAMFRVMRDPEAISTGFANLDVEPSLEFL
ncbi:ABC transporter ATP-binding protein [Lysobacter korlensis]|uniref:ABC transporter ATP-binding protein n=1 Tax=Lysobacter korlensis TaxID=553636 RepID=A0ABV6RIP7_9GAMM